VRTVKEPCGWWRRNLQYDVQQNGMLALVSFSGTIPSECGDKVFTLSVVDGPTFTESVLRWTWSEAGGVIRGKVRAGKTPDNAKLFYRDESEPLANLVRDMNKFSNNVMARQIFLALSAERGAPGSEAASDTIVRDWLKSKSIDAPGLVLDNGSGLSRETRITAGTLAAVLRSAWASPNMPEIVSSLSLLATDGTLRMRPATGAAGHAHLKGGTLNGVQSIAGFVIDPKGRRSIVVMIVNHANANAAQPALDALVEWIHAGRP
jgi:D-alanyl-D-alanine carboxypeptidase/D-alanyl-D-alanine-endopeptidase (penicillin-binding protein 4)